MDEIGPTELRISRSQIAFWRCRLVVWAWIPDRYLHGKHAPLLLTFSFGDPDPSIRWKEIVQPKPGHFTHHLELLSGADVDDEVRGWLQEAWMQAGDHNTSRS